MIFIDHLAPCFGAKLIAKYCELDSRVKDITNFILHWANIKGIINPTKGYLSSYALELMVIFFLQLQDDCILPSIQLYAKTELEPKMMPITSFQAITSAGRKYSHKKILQFNFAFNSVDVNEMKDKLDLPKNYENVATLVTKFFYYFSFDYPVRIHN